MRIAIAGASGYIARHTVAALLRRDVRAQDLILISRAPEKLEQWRRLGASVRAGDFTRPDELSAAFAGGEKALFVSVAPEGLLTPQAHATVHEAGLLAAARAGIRHVIVQSSVGTTQDPEPRDEVDRLTEAAVRASGMAWTILRTAAFADSRGREAKRNLREGHMISSLGSGRAYFVTRDDIAAAASVVLTTPGHENQIYNVVGQGVTAAEIQTLLHDITGKDVTLVMLDDVAFSRSLVERGRMPRIAANATLMYRQFREGQRPPRCDLPRLIGREGATLRMFLEANAQELVHGVPEPGREAVLV